MARPRDKRLRRVLRALKTLRQAEEAKLGAISRHSVRLRVMQADAISALNDDSDIQSQSGSSFAHYYAEQIRRYARDEQQNTERHEVQRRKLAHRQGQEKIIENMLDRLGEQIDRDAASAELSEVTERYGGKLPTSKT